MFNHRSWYERRMGEQITDAYDAGLFDGSMDVVKDRMYKKYYNETYTR